VHPPVPVRSVAGVDPQADAHALIQSSDSGVGPIAAPRPPWLAGRGNPTQEQALVASSPNVRRLLRSLNDPRELRKNALVAHFFQGETSRVALMRIRSVLHRAVDRIAPRSDSGATASRDARLHAIVVQADIAGEKHDTVARNLGLSARQFYRERTAAIARLEDALREELASGDAPVRHNLPWQPTSFIGRTREVDEIDDLLGSRRLVTITGSGGTGKTRIAVEVAARRKPPPRDGIWFVDFAAVNDDVLVLNRLAAVFDIRLADQDDRLGALIAQIKTREAILLLDNCEHVLDVIRPIADTMLRACPQISLLATSRERLGITGELTYPLSTLPVPRNPIATEAEARSYAAVELFAERATTAQHGLALSNDQFEAVADICRRLDGVALSIELAAARLPVLGLAALRAQLTRHFRIIAGGAHDLPTRHHALDAMITWSYDLLDERDRTVFRRLSIFARGWTLEAAESVCADDALDATAVLEALFSLVEKSLVAVDLSTAPPRYSFFESTRAYALERLVALAEHQALSLRYARWMAALADRAYDRLYIMPLARWEAEAAPELDNLLATLEWALSPDGDRVLGARIASGFQAFWVGAGLGIQGRRYLKAALEHVEPQEHPVLVARLLLAQCAFLYGKQHVETVRRAIGLLGESGDRRMLARCSVFLAFTLERMGCDAQALEAGDMADELLREVGLQRSPLYTRFLCDRSSLFRRLGRTDEAKALLEEALVLARVNEDVWSTCLGQTLLAEIEFATGDPHRAVVLGNDAIASARIVRIEVFSLCNLACYYLAAGQIEAAEEHARASLDLAVHAHPNVVQAAIQHLATVAALRGEAARAARLLGYVNAWYERVGSLRDATDERGYGILMTSLRKQLPDDEIATLAAGGAGLTEEQCIREALAPGRLNGGW
jgi:predicted ATPase